MRRSSSLVWCWPSDGLSHEFSRGVILSEAFGDRGTAGAIHRRRGSFNRAGARTSRARTSQRVHEITSASYKVGPAWLETLAGAGALPMPKEHLVRVIRVLVEGLVMQRLLILGLVPDPVIYAAFGALVAAPRPRKRI